MAHAGNVDPPRGHIGGHEDIEFVVAEFRQGAIPLVLAFVAVDGADLEAPLRQQFAKLFRAMLGAAKDQRLFAGMFFQIFLQKLRLVAIGDEMHPLHDLFGGLARGGHLHADGVAEIGSCDFLDILGHRGGEEKCLSFQGDMLGDLPQRMDETHVEHVIRLIQNQIARVLQRDIAAFQQVDQAAGGGDQHIGAPGQCHGLPVERGAADDGEDLDGGAFGENRKVIRDLRDKFTRRRKDQRAHVARARRVADIQQAVQKRQAEGRRLARAGLRQTHQVAALHDMGNGLHLNRRGLFEGGFFQGFQKLGRKAEIGEAGHVICLSGPFHGPRGPQQGRPVAGMRRLHGAEPLREGGNLWPDPAPQRGCSRGSGGRA